MEMGVGLSAARAMDQAMPLLWKPCLVPESPSSTSPVFTRVILAPQNPFCPFKKEVIFENCFELFLG